ncbi:MAG: hypothetical protein JNL80_01460 [Phycisphaerae bacterium]|jgi:hypothetical protein|nr:hypothetical protein [Phycisphaerae bacterium]
MEPTELLRLVGGRLDRFGCARFVTGSVASTVFGEPRFTNDIDIVVRMDEHQAALFASSFLGDDWYVSVEAAVDAARRRAMFNVIHVPSGLKADIIVARESPHDHARFSRVRPITMPDGRSEPFASPEDVILKKLEFYREGGSSKHLRDIASMIAVQGEAAIDWRYLEVWAERLGIASELERVRPKQ